MFSCVLFTTLHKVVLIFESVDEIFGCDQMKATEQYFSMVPFIIMLYKMVLAFESDVTIQMKTRSNTFLWCCVTY